MHLPSEACICRYVGPPFCSLNATCSYDMSMLLSFQARLRYNRLCHGRVAEVWVCRVAWPAVLQTWEQWQDVYSPEGQLLFAGLRAKVSVFHGQMTRIVPHTTTGMSRVRAGQSITCSRPLCWEACTWLLLTRHACLHFICWLQQGLARTAPACCSQLSTAAQMP